MALMWKSTHPVDHVVEEVGLADCHACQHVVRDVHDVNVEVVWGQLTIPHSVAAGRASGSGKLLTSS